MGVCDAFVMCRVALCGLWWLYCCAVVSSARLSVCLLCDRLWVHALAVFNIYWRQPLYCRLAWTVGE